MTLDPTGRNPLRHLLRAYDRAIRACDMGDAKAASRAIALLRSGLDASSPESSGFDDIFVWCERAVASGDFADASRRLVTLRNAWQTAERVRPSLPERVVRGALHIVPTNG